MQYSVRPLVENLLEFYGPELYCAEPGSPECKAKGHKHPENSFDTLPQDQQDFIKYEVFSDLGITQQKVKEIFEKMVVDAYEISKNIDTGLDDDDVSAEEYQWQKRKLDVYERGLEWYRLAKKACQLLSSRYGFSMAATVGAVAATSPGVLFHSMDWLDRPGGLWEEMVGNSKTGLKSGENLYTAQAVMRALRDTRPVTLNKTQAAVAQKAAKSFGVENWEVKPNYTYYPEELPLAQRLALSPYLNAGLPGGDGPAATVKGKSNLLKAAKILLGIESPKNALTKGGANIQKTWSFYDNLLNSEDSAKATIDMWMLRGVALLSDPDKFHADVASKGLKQTTSDIAKVLNKAKAYKPNSKTKDLYARHAITKLKTKDPLYPAIALAYANWKAGVGTYPFFEGAIQHVASRYGLPPATVQAICWVMLRELVDLDDSGGDKPKMDQLRAANKHAKKKLKKAYPGMAVEAIGGLPLEYRSRLLESVFGELSEPDFVVTVQAFPEKGFKPEGVQKIAQHFGMTQLGKWKTVGSDLIKGIFRASDRDEAYNFSLALKKIPYVRKASFGTTGQF